MQSAAKIKISIPIINTEPKTNKPKWVLVMRCSTCCPDSLGVSGIGMGAA